LSSLIPEARSQFWHTTLPAICHEMEHRTGLSRQALRRAGIFADDDGINRLLDEQEAIIKDTLIQQRQGKNFLEHYRGNNG
ncbi:MAG TPA: hypothetical protein VD706_01825, partial [Candidatus Saccharimonadales bacterium]|nr:hypothetical protein [Candidatus Saccharimonadales bacterium]